MGLKHQVGYHPPGDGYHLHWLNVDEEGQTTDRRTWGGPSWFLTLQEAHDMAERWLADLNASTLVNP